MQMFVQDGRNPALEAFAERFPSQKLALRPGEILIRDPALWHRGTPNPTDEPRMMLTLCYLRRDASCEYASPYFNLDKALFEQLGPRVARLFAHAFPETRRLQTNLFGRSRRWLARSLGRLNPARPNRAA
jgi:hypothetical protein